MKVIVLSGPSGSGKTTIKSFLLSHFKQLSFSISATTREKRFNEQEGKDYYFISLDEFKLKIKENKFIEYEEVYNETYYGTLWSEITRINELNLIPLLDIDVVGSINIKKKFLENAITIFIHPGNIEAIKARLINRHTESMENIIKRINKASLELNYAEQFDQIIMNNGNIKDSKNKAIELVCNFIN